MTKCTQCPASIEDDIVENAYDNFEGFTMIDGLCHKCSRQLCIEQLEESGDD